MGGSALTADIPVPRNRSMDEPSTEIPVTYVPARNTIFLPTRSASPRWKERRISSWE
jgi:7-cyano-7-deazaguanine synthase in queuosine biosynthesis